VWGVVVEGGQSVRNAVLDPLTTRLRIDPKLEVLGPVVVPHSIEVVDVLAGGQGATEDALHDDGVLSSPDSTGDAHQDVAVTVETSTECLWSLPERVPVLAPARVVRITPAAGAALD
jgi:hypothetical protein